MYIFIFCQQLLVIMTVYFCYTICRIFTVPGMFLNGDETTHFICNSKVFVDLMYFVSANFNDTRFNLCFPCFNLVNCIPYNGYIYIWNDFHIFIA